MFQNRFSTKKFREIPLKKPLVVFTGKCLNKHVLIVYYVLTVNSTESGGRAIYGQQLNFSTSNLRVGRSLLAVIPAKS